MQCIYNRADKFYLNEYMPVIRLLPLSAILLLCGCASTSGYHNPQDPLEPLNRGIYQFNDTLDRTVIKPVAEGYKAVVPAPGRTMVNNFFSNLNDVLVTVNDVLQLKLKQAVSDFGRVLINTSVGAFGLVDAATVAGFEKHDEDFGQTLGYWGISSGPYLVLPVLGPSSVRDGIGLYVNGIPDPIYRTRPILVRDEVIVADGIRKRTNLLDEENILETAQVDRYSFLRDAYLQRRQSLVYDGNPPHQKYEDEEEDDTSIPPSSSKPAAPPAGGNVTSPAGQKQNSD
jgi:phospholipid-binding lipoprotein MlaA